MLRLPNLVVQTRSSDRGADRRGPPIRSTTPRPSSLFPDAPTRIVFAASSFVYFDRAIEPVVPGRMENGDTCCISPVAPLLVVVEFVFDSTVIGLVWVSPMCCGIAGGCVQSRGRFLWICVDFFLVQVPVARKRPWGSDGREKKNVSGAR